MPYIYRFGVFAFDPDRSELRRDDRVVRLQPQPAQVLAVLLERAGGLVTRDELRAAIWGHNTFVDFDRGLNFCIAQIRAALADNATTPRYVRTVPKSGYEFICPVERRPREGLPPRQRATSAHGPRWTWIGAASFAAIVLGTLVIHSRTAAQVPVPIVAVARFDNETGDPAFARFTDNLADNVVERLTESSGGRYLVAGNAAILRGPRETRDLGAIGASLHATYVVLGQVQRDAGRVRVLGHLIHLPEQTHVAVARVENTPDQTLAEGDAIAARLIERFSRALYPPHPPR